LCEHVVPGVFGKNKGNFESRLKTTALNAGVDVVSVAAKLASPMLPLVVDIKGRKASFAATKNIMWFNQIKENYEKTNCRN
jgi:hypothetical protein